MAFIVAERNPENQVSPNPKLVLTEYSSGKLRWKNEGSPQNPLLCDLNSVRVSNVVWWNGDAMLDSRAASCPSFATMVDVTGNLEDVV